LSVHIGVELALLLHHDFRAAGGQPDEIEAEAGDRADRLKHPAARETAGPITPDRGHGLSGVPHDRAHRAIGAEEARFQPPRALALPVHAMTTSRPAATGAAITSSVAQFGKPLLDDVTGSGLRGLIGASPWPHACSSKVVSRRRTCGDFMARARGDIADGFSPARRRPRIMHPQCRARTPAPLDGCGFLAIVDDAAMDTAASRARADRCARNAALTANPAASAPRTPSASNAASPPNRWAHRFLVKNVEEQAMRGIERHAAWNRSHQSAMAFSALMSAASSGVEHLQLRQMARALGERQADLKPELAAAAHPGGNRKRLFCFVTTMHGPAVIPSPLVGEG